jgi:hypothetical protein
MRRAALLAVCAVVALACSTSSSDTPPDDTVDSAAPTGSGGGARAAGGSNVVDDASAGGSSSPDARAGGGAGGTAGSGAGGSAGTGASAGSDASPGGDGFGILPSGLRDKMKWPFASSSVWNTPVGSGAQYQLASVAANSHGGYPTTFTQDQDVVVMKPAAPSTDVYYNGVGWNGGDRCVKEGNLLTSVPVPGSYTLPSSGENNSAAFLAADGKTVMQNQPFTRCAAGASATTLVTFPDLDIYGPGIGGAHGGSGLSALGGTIRLGELASGRIHHVMKVNLWAADYYHCCNWHWPATSVDGYADATTYGGPNANFGPGSLLALLPTFDTTSLATAPGKILAQAFKDYGAYVVDDTYWNAWALIAEQGPDGRVVDEFQTLYGFSMKPADGDPFMTDVKTIFGALQIVTNNAQTTLGGGGSPRVALAPAIGN